MDRYILESLAELNRQILLFVPEGISADISKSHRLINSSESFDQLVFIFLLLCLYVWAAQSCKDVLLLRHIQINLRHQVCDGCLSPNSTQHNIRLRPSATCWSQEAAQRDMCCLNRLKNFSSNYVSFWCEAVTPDASSVGRCKNLIGAVCGFNLISTLQKMILRAVSRSRIIKVSLERIGVLLGIRGKNKL